MTLAEAVPAEGSGLTLPLDLRAIASKCTGSYYAPRRFAAVQLAFHTPRARVLVFRALLRNKLKPLHTAPHTHAQTA